MKKNDILFIAVALILSVATYFAFQQRYLESPPIFLYISFFMFAILSMIGHSQLIKAAQNKSPQFVTIYMGLTAIKMFIILSVLTIYLWFNKTHLFAVGIIYAGSYLLYLILDTAVLLKQLNSKK